jgi:hypothetical protein
MILIKLIIDTICGSGTHWGHQGPGHAYMKCVIFAK